MSSINVQNQLHLEQNRATELQSYRATELQSYSEKYWPSKGTPSILHKKLGDPRRVDNAYNLLDNFLEL